MLANAAKNMIKTRLAATQAVAAPLNVEWVAPNDSEKLSEIYKLRYQVMIEDAKKSKRGNPFPEDHYCLKGKEFRGEKGGEERRARGEGRREREIFSCEVARCVRCIDFRSTH